jgi:Uma2 family endonuclease
VDYDQRYPVELTLGGGGTRRQRVVETDEGSQQVLGSPRQQSAPAFHGFFRSSTGSGSSRPERYNLFMGLLREDWVQRHRLTVEEFYRMGEAGLLAPDARVELIEGEIIDMAPIGPTHASIVDELSERLRSAVGDAALVRIQNPLHLGKHAAPQPDIALVRRSPGRYRERHPGAADTLLVIEIADTTLRYDTEVKVPMYIEHGIDEVWIFDVEGRRLLICRRQGEGRNAEVRAVTSSELSSVGVPGLPGVTVDLSGLV